MSKIRYLKKIGKATIFGYNEILARRSDVVECDEKGNVVDAPKPSAPADEAQTPAAVRAARANRDEKIKLAEDDADKRTPEEKAKDDEQKAELIQFAKDRYQTDIDPADSLEVVKARIAKLTGGKAKGGKKAKATTEGAE